MPLSTSFRTVRLAASAGQEFFNRYTNVNTRTSRRIAAVTLALLTASQLAGCGGSDGSSSAPPGNNGGTGGTGGSGGNGGGTPVTVSGKAADGYLSGATVCLDLDSDMSCDTGEPTVQTGAGGAFTLTIPEGVTAASHPIVVQVSETTIDEDTGVAVGKPYVLSAPAGASDFISPLTTVVYGMLQQNPALTLDDVVTQVKLSIGAGADVSLFEDYVAAKQDANSAAAEDYERLHLIAQVAAKTMAENHEVIMEAANQQGIDTSELNAALLALVTNEAIAGLQGAARAVDEAGEDFDIDAVAIETADVTNLAQQVAEAEAAASAVPVSIQALLAQGVYWMWARDDEYEYGFTEAADANRLQERRYFHEGDAWVLAEEASEASFYLGEEGWIEKAESAANYTVTYEGDGSATLDRDGTDFSLKYSAAALDVSGKPIKDYLGFAGHEAVAPTIAGEPLFSNGAKLYQVNFIVVADTYELSSWHDCEPQHADPSGECNIVFGYASNAQFVPAQSFAELIYPSEPAGGNWFSVGEGLEIRVVQGGAVQITDRNAAEGQQVSHGSWEFKTVHGEQIMMLTLPDEFLSRLWDSGQQILAVRDGFVRRGTFLPAGSPETIGETQFNEIAFQDIQDNSSVF
jgi:hypothetical protein